MFSHIKLPCRCLVDSQLKGSRSQFMPRTSNEKLQLSIDAFRFYKQEGGEVRGLNFRGLWRLELFSSLIHLLSYRSSSVVSSLLFPSLTLQTPNSRHVPSSMKGRQHIFLVVILSMRRDRNCIFMSSRWRSSDGPDLLCSRCQRYDAAESQNPAALKTQVKTSNAGFQKNLKLHKGILARLDGVDL